MIVGAKKPEFPLFFLINFAKKLTRKPKPFGPVFSFDPQILERKLAETGSENKGESIDAKNSRKWKSRVTLVFRSSLFHLKLFINLELLGSKLKTTKNIL